ncbi:MAG: hypothetical protein RL685_212 [Pseudomonadota bacterium]|jgi:predicted phosphodiesterase
MHTRARSNEWILSSPRKALLRRTEKVLLGCASALLAACGGGQSQQMSATSLGDVSNPVVATEHGGAAAAAECGAGTLTEAGSQALDRLPYLQRISESGASVLFTTIAADQTPPLLELRRPSGELVATAEAVEDPAASNGQQRLASWNDLEPNSTYCYSIAGWTAPTGLRTAPRTGSDQAVRFVVFGDSGSDSDGQRSVHDQLSQVPFDLILHTGDVAYEAGSLAALERTFFDVYANYLRNAPVFPTTGNHDYRTDSGEPFRQVFALPDNGGPDGNERWYSFNFGAVHFVALDTEWELPQQTEWLARDLGANHLPWTIAYLHRPPFSSGEHGSNLAVRSAFTPLFERYGVQLVFAGHDHDYERTVPINGVTYVVTGGGGRGTRPVGSSSFTAFSEDALHFVAVSIEGTVLLLHAIGATGRQLDSLQLSL